MQKYKQEGLHPCNGGCVDHDKRQWGPSVHHRSPSLVLLCSRKSLGEMEGSTGCMRHGEVRLKSRKSQVKDPELERADLSVPKNMRSDCGFVGVCKTEERCSKRVLFFGGYGCDGHTVTVT